jgi:DNA repair protein RecN (Recombination protein N)
MPTVIFDEIDTGVSGDVAQKIGNMLKRMGSDMQLLAISHLPQVAARAAQHIKVEKVDENGRAVSRVYVLTSAEQIEEIARLMSGEQVTSAALENARDLINA